MVSQKQYNEITPEQFELLIKKQIVKEQIFIQLYGDEFDYRILKVNKGDDGYSFVVRNIDTRDNKTISYKDIRIIEDMPIDRIIDAYLVDEELNTYNIVKKTDVCKTIIGNKNGSINGIELENGMKLVLHNDKTVNYNNKVLTVNGVGSSIKLSAPRGRPRKNH